MAQGDIPVEGSAVVGQNFSLRAARSQSTDFTLNVNALNKDLHISIDNGDPDPQKRKTFEADLFSPGWKLRITPR